MIVFKVGSSTYSLSIVESLPYKLLCISYISSGLWERVPFIDGYILENAASSSTNVLWEIITKLAIFSKPIFGT